jgi:hypothetical protein
MNSGYKTFSRIITKRLQTISEHLLMEQQTWILENVMDNDFTVKQHIQARRQHDFEIQVVVLIFVVLFDQVDIINQQQQR